MTHVSCSWCHESGRPGDLCSACGHRLGLARLDCDCGSCLARSRPADADGGTDLTDAWLGVGEAPAPRPARCPTCGGRKVGPAGCRSCPVRVTLTPAGARALAAA